VKRADGTRETFELTARLDTLQEVQFFRHGGVLGYLLRKRIG
jgi:aconitate hydratase